MTPLIDVLLVLLILFLITLPVMTHKVPITLPPEGVGTEPPPPANRLDILPGGALLWNGAQVSQSSLPTRFSNMADNA